MRLIEVEIENYKQYAGAHVFRPGEKAMVAIVGQNGAGKTTLFEAIEWCLYNPTRIKNDSITPRMHGGKPRVRVVLEDTNTGVVYEVERLLKGGSTQAEIYRQDQPESPLVQGTRQVTDYVTRELTGLSHTAFVATFFTRQKELTFFGDLGATERRAQVGRLLGLETIRIAQRSIGEQRSRKQAEAKVKRDQYEEQTAGLDFPTERARLDTVIMEQTVVRDATRSEAAVRQTETSAATAARELAQQRFAQNASLLQELERAAGEHRRFEEMLANARNELEAIGRAEAEIVTQQDEAGREPNLRSALEAHDQQKQKLETSNRLHQELTALFDGRDQLESTLGADERAGLAGDRAAIERARHMVAAFDGAIDRIGKIDLEALRQRFDNTRTLAELAKRKDEESAKLEKMEALAGDLERQVETLRQDGTPAERVARIHAERTQLREGATSASSLASQTEQRMRPLQTLERNLRNADFGDACPTCARPFQPGEADRTLHALAEQIAVMDVEIASQRQTAEHLTSRADQLGKNLAALEQEAEEYQKLLGRIEKGAEVIQGQRELVATIELELGRLKRAANRQDVPQQPEIERLDTELRDAEALCQRRPQLEIRREQVRASIERQVALEEQLDSLGTIAYDIDAHRQDYAAWERARDAVARIEELQKRVAERPARETAIVTATSRLTELDAEQEGLRGQIAELGFERSEVDEANRIEAEALDRERAATAAAHAAENALREAQREREDLDKLESRLKALSDEALAAGVAADELDRIYREFARFEKYVAVAVTPVLGEIASELLEKVTDGKYDRIEFTEDYGIEVYDGEEDRFPLNQFSGGERDVIALCARLALSQVIGGQAATPIQFMVLDEVFGSLDIDRRRNLMEMLQRLMEENRAFQQLFVISHVDDVRAGPMFDEVWRVAETSDGISQLEQVSVTGALEDY
ncbi:MAG: SMC family ATPase [Thermomicrobiales bacterium]|nr:SMC family ATPase [Thermomicrobiales bacterium]